MLIVTYAMSDNYNVMFAESVSDITKQIIANITINLDCHYIKCIFSKEE